MSRTYEIGVEVRSYTRNREPYIIEALKEHWDFEDFYSYYPEDIESVLSAIGDGNLTNEISEEEFAERITKAVWKANEGYCSIVVCYAFLEIQPYEEYVFEQESYKRLVGGSNDD